MSHTCNPCCTGEDGTGWSCEFESALIPKPKKNNSPEKGIQQNGVFSDLSAFPEDYGTPSFVGGYVFYVNWYRLVFPKLACLRKIVFLALLKYFFLQLDDFYILFLGAYLCICTLTCHDTGVEIGEQLWGVGSLPLVEAGLISAVMLHYTFPDSWCALQASYPQSLHKSATNVPLRLAFFFFF